MATNDISGIERQFSELLTLIQHRRSEASQAVNENQLLTAWSVGGYISAKLKSEEWGSKVVMQFAEYIRTNAPEIKGFSRRNIYNMVMFYDEYSSPTFLETVAQYVGKGIVQPVAAQIENTEFVQLASGQIQCQGEIVQSLAGQFVQTPSAQMPRILILTSYSNHIEILCNCRSNEKRLFYILYASKERLKKRELQRCIANDTFSSLLAGKGNLSKGLLQAYPQAGVMFKDTAFVDFLGLPKRHTEKKLRDGLLSHIKEFVLELGKDFLFVDQEYRLTVGASTFKADLLFYHRGLQALVAIELKRTKFHPRDLGQLEFYLEALDRDVKRSNENPSIGIILCPNADKVVVEYAMNRCMSPAMIAEYKRLLIPKEKMQTLLQEYCTFLENKTEEQPTGSKMEQIEKRSKKP